MEENEEAVETLLRLGKDFMVSPNVLHTLDYKLHTKKTILPMPNGRNLLLRSYNVAFLFRIRNIHINKVFFIQALSSNTRRTLQVAPRSVWLLCWADAGRRQQYSKQPKMHQRQATHTRMTRLISSCIQILTYGTQNNFGIRKKKTFFEMVILSDISRTEMSFTTLPSLAKLPC